MKKLENSRKKKKRKKVQHISSLDWSKKADTLDHWFWEITKNKGKKGGLDWIPPSPYPPFFCFYFIFLWFLWSKN
jgi:hypothetical protein